MLTAVPAGTHGLPGPGAHGLAWPHAADRKEGLAELLVRIASGDQAAFDSLYRVTRRPLLNVILRVNACQAQAEELLQEVYLSIWQAASRFDGSRAGPMTWLCTIARNRAIDSLRRRRTEPVTVNLDGHPDDDSEEAWPALSDPGPGPWGHVLGAAQARRLASCVQGLNGGERQCVELAFYQGLSHAEIANHLGTPLGTVKSQTRRALAKLKGDRCLASLAV